MNHSPSRYYDDGDEYQEYNSRDRSLRALEGRYSNDRSRNTGHPNMDHDDDVAESENNTADIFMSIAREDSSTFAPRRNTDQDSDEDQSAGVSSVYSFTSCLLCVASKYDFWRCIARFAHKCRLHFGVPICGLKCNDRFLQLWR